MIVKGEELEQITDQQRHKKRKTKMYNTSYVELDHIAQHIAQCVILNFYFYSSSKKKNKNK